MLSQFLLLTILTPWVDLAVLLRGSCLFDFWGSFYLKNREHENKNHLSKTGWSYPEGNNGTHYHLVPSLQFRSSLHAGILFADRNDIFPIVKQYVGYLLAGLIGLAGFIYSLVMSFKGESNFLIAIGSMALLLFVGRCYASEGDEKWHSGELSWWGVNILLANALCQLAECWHWYWWYYLFALHYVTS